MTVQDGRTDVLVVAAGAPDLLGLRAHFGDKLEGVVRGLVVRSKVVGFGPGVAGATTARGLLALNPRAVVLLGSCGVYPNLPQYQPHDVVVTSRVLALDHAVIQGAAEWPTPMSTTVDASAAMVAGLSAGRHRTHVAPVASPLALTRSDSLASRITSVTGAHVENTDAFGVACAAAGAPVPFACALGVANIVGSTGRADWQQFQRDAVTQAANALIAWLHAGAAGLPFG
ncbi:MAG: hypothetical protein K1X94_04560 [Sandaracinaceae bacterium]|jgi:futalosine hydrolase|nr:hypothetical protein [Sandaracinaceae bacterium]